MKHFKLIGPQTTREFDIEDEQMLDIKVLSISDYEKSRFQNDNTYDTNFLDLPYDEANKR